MRLQVNQRGAWRDVVKFDDERETFMAVGEAVLTLARALGDSAKWRIVDAGLGVLGYLEAPDFEWSKPRWAKS